MAGYLERGGAGGDHSSPNSSRPSSQRSADRCGVWAVPARRRLIYADTATTSPDAPLVQQGFASLHLGRDRAASLAGLGAWGRCGGWRRWLSCQILVGVALGPSLLGQIAPGLHAALFSGPVLAALDGISSLGVLLYVLRRRAAPGRGHAATTPERYRHHRCRQPCRAAAGWRLCRWLDVAPHAGRARPAEPPGGVRRCGCDLRCGHRAARAGGSAGGDGPARQRDRPGRDWPLRRSTTRRFG